MQTCKQCANIGCKLFYHEYIGFFGISQHDVASLLNVRMKLSRNKSYKSTHFYFDTI